MERVEKNFSFISEEKILSHLKMMGFCHALFLKILQLQILERYIKFLGLIFI